MRGQWLVLAQEFVPVFESQEPLAVGFQEMSRCLPVSCPA